MCFIRLNLGQEERLMKFPSFAIRYLPRSLPKQASGYLRLAKCAVLLVPARPDDTDYQLDMGFS
jgi:hypothetical protein